MTSFHYAPDYLWGIQVGGTGTFESGLPLNPTISINAGAMTGTGATSTGTVNGSGASNRAPFDTRNGFRQTGRKTFDMRLSKAFDFGDRKQIVVLWEAFNVFNWVNYTAFTTTAYRATSSAFDADGQQGDRAAGERRRVQGADRREQYALRAARHANRRQVPVVTRGRESTEKS